jgi:hypothetical protein
VNARAAAIEDDDDVVGGAGAGGGGGGDLGLAYSSVHCRAVVSREGKGVGTSVVATSRV